MLEFPSFTDLIHWHSNHYCAVFISNSKLSQILGYSQEFSNSWVPQSIPIVGVGMKTAYISG